MRVFLAEDKAFVRGCSEVKLHNEMRDDCKGALLLGKEIMR